MTAQATEISETAAPSAAPRVAPRSSVARRVGLSLLLVAALALALGLIVRFGVQTDLGRSLVVRLADEVRLGPAGRLEVSGLEGDVFGRFSVARLTVVDAHGPWLEARDVRLNWRPQELVARRVHALDLHVGDLVVLRRPVLQARPRIPPSEAPVSVRIDRLAARIETRAAFSQVAGDWDAQGRLDYARSGRAQGVVAAASRLHRGDGVDLDFVIGPRERLRLLGDAKEAQGGALAGALGLSVHDPFEVHARADGSGDGGTFAFDARSGAVRPLVANGRWSASGATVDARVSLAASRLTHYFADRIGPELTLAITAKSRSDGLYAVTLNARGARAQAQALGPIDFQRRRSPGLDLALQVSDLSLWTHPLKVGPTHARGTFTGDLQTFAYRGRLAGAHLVQSGFDLAMVAGPAYVTRSRSGWTFGGDLQGDGGRGSDVTALLLGNRPTLKIDAALENGRPLLIRQLDVRGADVIVQAHGGQTLLGGFSFTGRAAIPDLSRLYARARGRLEGDWTASARSHDPAWTFEFLTHAASFASGRPELDRLLGDAPRLAGHGVFLDGAFAFSDAKVDGRAATIDARGRLARGGGLDLALDWRAQGPFLVGPLVIAGRMQGAGRVGGTLSHPRADLAADLSSVDLGRIVLTPAHLTLAFLKDDDGISGRMALAGRGLTGVSNAASTDFRLVDRGVDLRNIAVDASGLRVSGAASLRDGEPSSADLALSLSRGAFIEGGHLGGALRITSDARGPVVAATFDGEALVVPGSPGPIDRIAIKAKGPLDRLPMSLSAAGRGAADWRFDGTGLLSRAGSSRTLALMGGGSIDGSPFRTTTPLSVLVGPQERRLQGRLTIAGGTAALDGLQQGQTLNAHATLTGVDLSTLSAEYRGRLTAALELVGAGADLHGRLDASLADARTRDAPSSLALQGELHATLARSILGVRVNVANAQGLHATADIQLPTTTSALPFKAALDRTRALHGQFDARGELRPLWDLFVGGERTLAGELVAKGELGGTLDNPVVTGSANLTQGDFRDVATGLALERLALRADFGRSLIQVREFSGGDGHGGTAAGSGEVSLARDGASTFRVKLTRFQLIDNELGRATASGVVDVTRDATGRAKLSGKLHVDRGDLTTRTPTPTGAVAMEVEEINLPRSGGAPTQVARPSAAGLVALDVGISTAGGVLVRGKGVNAELSLDAHVGGTTAAPELTGESRVVRGSFDFSGKRFDFDPGGLIRLATKPEHILLDLKAERNDPALDAVVRIRGTAARPEITLTSQPVLPQDEILSRVLFGVSASQLSAYQAAELATALAGLASGGGFDILANLRQFAGLDRLTLGGDASGPAISGGKYLSRNLYLELTGAAIGRSQAATTAAQIQRTGPSAEVEWRVRRNLSIVSQVWAGGDAQLSVRFRRSY